MISLSGKVRSSFVQWLLLAAALLMLGSVIGWNLYSEHIAIDARERASLATQARVIDENLGRQLLATNLTLDSIRSDLPYFMAQADGKERVSRRLQAMREAMPGMRALTLFDAAGTVTARSPDQFVGQNFANREYFQIARKGGDPAMLYVAPPFLAATGEYVINLVKVLSDERGTFSGIILASLDPGYFSALLASVNYAPDMWSALIHGDGKAFQTVPTRPGIAGTDIARPGSFFTRHIESGQKATVMTGTTFGTGEARMIAQRTIKPEYLTMDKPFVLGVARDLPSIFAPWRKGLYQQGGLFLLLAMATSLGLYFHQKRQRAYDLLVAKQDAQLHALVQAIPDLIWLKDQDGVYLSCNAQFERFFGANEAAIVGKTDYDFLDKLVADFYRENDRLAMTAGKPRSNEQWMSFADGSYRGWFETIKTPIQDAKGRLIGVLGIARDINERKKLEEGLRASDERNRTMLAVSPDGIWIHNNAKIAYANDALVKMLGYASSADLVGRTIYEFFVPEFRKSLQERVAKVVTTLGPAPLTETAMLRRDASRIEVETSASAFQQGDVVWNISIIRDITERKRTEAELSIAAIAFESQEGMMITDAAGVILRVNRAFTEDTGYEAEEVVGQTPRLLKSGHHDAAFYAEMWQTIHSKGTWQGEVWDRRKNGEVFPKWLTISAVRGKDGAVTHYVGTHIDISQRKATENQLHKLAFYDPLTQLPNRRLLLDRLGHALAGAARSQHQGAIMFIDLDRFKTINDTQGHDVGDQLLIETAARLQASVRQGDTVARLGGDEFVVMLEDLEADELVAAQVEGVAEKILAALDLPYRLEINKGSGGRNTIEYHCTASIGVTLFGAARENVDELLKQADLAMYQAKDSGRNTIRFFDPDMQATVTSRVLMEADLREAVKKGQFLLHYQPQVDGGAHRLTGAEALLRWQHPRRGMVPPAEFISLAEESGLILPLGYWVLKTACAQLAAWAIRPEMAHLTIAVNVSASQFHHKDFTNQVLAALDRTGANPQRLKLELTESLLVSNVEELIAKMTALKAKGVGFSLDDFGTGYSSLSYLKRLPLDQLKIDQSFVRDLLTDPNDAAIAKMIVGLAESLGLTVIAEGVETAEQRDFLASLGCHAYQGYLFSRPLSLEAFEEFAG